MKHKLYIHVKAAVHFLSWEMPYFQQYFDVVDHPADDTILFVFGPDVLISGASLPARLRAAFLFPGFGYSAYHDLIHRYGMQRIIDDHYSLVFANPGPMAEAFASSPKMRLCPFSVNTDQIQVTRFRKSIDKLLHASADYPQKDWKRSREAMRLTGLSYEVFPHRPEKNIEQIWHKAKRYAYSQKWFKNSAMFLAGYENHQTVIKKYSQYDGFVHIAGETPPSIDGKYTATLLEAGLTGAILFWHDTLGLGNDFETVFSLPLDPAEAAAEILQIRKNINVEAHSKRTVEEIHEHVKPGNAVRVRYEAIKEVLG